MIRTITIYATLAVGLVLTFTGFFALMGALYLFLGTAAALVFFLTVSGTVVAGISALFINDKIEEDDGWCGGAVEGGRAQ